MGEISAVSCEVYDAVLAISCRDQLNATVEYPAAKNVFVGEKNGGLYIRQAKRPLFSRKAQVITINLTEHTVCEINLCGQKPTICVGGGIYGGVLANLDGGELTVCGCDVASFEVPDGGANIRINHATIKGGLIVSLRQGNLIAENSFAMRAECKVGKGNIGFAGFACKDCGLEAAEGNITAVFNGDEADYSANIVAKCGTANRESFLNENASGKIRAYAERGGVVLEFASEKESQKEL